MDLILSKLDVYYVENQLKHILSQQFHNIILLTIQYRHQQYHHLLRTTTNYQKNRELEM